MKTFLTYTICLMIPAFLFQSCSMKLLPYAIDEDDYLKGESVSSDIYKKNSVGIFYNPFNFGHDDCGRLLLITTDNHPEIETVELIVQDENMGAVVVIYYHDGRVENYISNGYASEKEYLKLDKNWDIIGEQDFIFTFNDTPNGIDFKLDIRIKEKYRINITVRENREETKRYNVLATIGAELEQVKRFPLIYMKEMAILPVEGATVNFEINGESVNVQKIPIKVYENTCYRIIYSLERIPFFWNEEQEGEFLHLKLNGNTMPEDLEGYTFSDNKEYHEIESIEYKVNNHKVRLKFSPAFPDIAALKDGIQVTGKFSLGIDETGGVVGGAYKVSNSEGQINIDLLPEKCWGSVGKKNWAAKYAYHAKIEPAADNKLKIKSKWIINQ